MKCKVQVLPLKLALNLVAACCCVSLILAQSPSTQTPKSQAPAPQASQSGNTSLTKASSAKPASTPAKANDKKPQTATKAKASRSKSKPVPEKKPWEQFKLNPHTRVFIDFTNANPDKVFAFYSKASGITILKDPAFKTPLTLNSAKTVGLREAFNILNADLDLNGYSLQKKGDMLEVVKPQPAPPPTPPSNPVPMPPPAPQQPTSVIRTYQLQFASAEQVARIINEVFTPQQLEDLIKNLQGPNAQMQMQQMQMQMGGQKPAEQPKPVRASYDDYTNAVVVSATPQIQDQVASLIKDLDKSTETPTTTEMFRMQYIPAQQAVDAIQDVLDATEPTGRGLKQQTQNQNNGYFFYNPFGEQQKNHSQIQVATAIQQTNTVLVTATKTNMETIKKLIANIDQPAAFAGTTFLITLQNAKATDMATLLTTVFTQSRNNNQGGFFDFLFNGYTNQQNRTLPTDISETGQIVTVRDLTGKVNVTADPNTNSLVFVTAPGNMPYIRQLVSQLDQVAQQVMIETVIVEAQLDNTTKLGTEWSFLQGHSSASQTFGLQGSSPPLQGVSYTLSGALYNVFMNMLQSDNRFKILDTPRIFTSNNVASEIDVSTKVPYITSQEATGVGTQLISNYDFLDVGVKLDVTPRVTANGMVSMDVTQMADDLEGYTTYNAPIVDHRQAQTTVSVKDGETVILGGIIQHSTSLSKASIPLLGDIPIIGQLFRSTSLEHKQTELMVLMTPHIVHTNEDAQELRQVGQKELSPGSASELKDTLKKQGAKP